MKKSYKLIAQQAWEEEFQEIQHHTIINECFDAKSIYIASYICSYIIAAISKHHGYTFWGDVPYIANLKSHRLVATGFKMA